MPTTKKHFEKNGRKFTKEGKTAVSLFENAQIVNQGIDKEEVKRLVESSGLRYPAKVLDLLEQPNAALIRVIKAGWSINGNYYEPSVLKELPKVIEKQGPIQFSNHLEDGSKLDRKWEEVVSYSKYVWYDEATQGVYAVVKFPKEKVDTGWLLNVIREDPEVIGVSIAAAVYVTEDFEKDGKTGDRVDGWAYFDSADYVLFASAGGQGIEAGKIQEKIKKAKESASRMPKFKWRNKPTSINIAESVERIEDMKEEIRSFLNRYYENEAWYEIQAVLGALSSFLSDVLWIVTSDGYDPEAKLAEIESAFKQASDIMINLEFFKNPNAEYDANGQLIAKESTQKQTEGNNAMTIELLKKDHPEVYEQIVRTAKEAAKAELETANQAALTAEKQKTTDVQTKLTEAERKLDEYTVKEVATAKKLVIDTAVAESKLDAEYITPKFRQTLEAAKDEAEVKELLAERKALIEKTKTTTTAREHQESPAGGAPSVDDLMKSVKEEVKRDKK